ncbi:MAG: putative sugar O-methyltransferase, partial [Vicinamibacteria bacterium]
MSRESSFLLEIIRESYGLARDMGLPNITSPYWEALLASGRQGHGGKGDFLSREDLWLDFRNNVITKGLDNSNVPEEARPRMREKCERIYARVRDTIPRKFFPYLEESPIGNPATVEIEGRRVSLSSLEYTWMLCHLEPYLVDVEVAVDIGGGFGGLARLLKSAHPRLKLVLLDLPEVSAIQTYFLKTAFASAKLLTLRDVRDVDPLDPASLEFDFLVLPGQLIERLVPRSFELVINTRSMMEMDSKTVSFYLDHIQQKLRSGGFFYCLNRYEKKTRFRDYPFDDRWYVSHSEPWPSVIDQNPHHEIVAGRASHRVLSGLREHVESFPPRDGKLE